MQKSRFPPDGSQLSRYAARLNAAEINTSFYRFHDPAVYARWAAATPEAFRFSLKIPRLISHDRALMRAREPLERFLDESSALGPKRGALLLQLPPSFAFDARSVARFFDLVRARYEGPLVCEPRHASWTSAAATRVLVRCHVARVAADPPRADGLGEPAGWDGLIYYRWHGSPRPYFSPYSDERLTELAARIAASTVDVWCVFDNTGSGAAAANALTVSDDLARRETIRTPV